MINAKIRLPLAVLVVIALFTSVAFAAPTTDLTQTINAGTLATDIKDASRVTVGSPTFAMGNQTFSFDCLSGGTASTGTLGSNTQRIYVTNPDAADNGWTLSIAATGGNTARWANGGATQHFDFNDPGGSGCTDGADGDSEGGQLTIDPSVSTITQDCATCDATGITKGASTAFSQGVTDTVTMINAAAGSNDIWRGYMTAAGLSQAIPAEQPADSYSVNLTLSVVAL